MEREIRYGTNQKQLLWTALWKAIFWSISLLGLLTCATIFLYLEFVENQIVRKISRNFLFNSKTFFCILCNTYSYNLFHIQKQKSQGNTFFRVSFLIKLCRAQAYNFNKKEIVGQVFSC